MNDDLVVEMEGQPETGRDLITIHLGDGSVTPFLTTPASEGQPSFSPDGRWVAYTSDVSGMSEIYVRPFPGPGPRHSVSSGGGMSARWSMNGRELFYQSGDRILAVDVTTTPTFSAAPPRELFDARAYDLTRGWDVGPDGRFVLVRSDASMMRQIILVQNFAEELEERVGN